MFCLRIMLLIHWWKREKKKHEIYGTFAPIPALSQLFQAFPWPLTAPGRGEGVMPLYRTHLVWDCSTVAFCMYLPLEKTSSTAVKL